MPGRATTSVNASGRIVSTLKIKKNLKRVLHGILQHRFFVVVFVTVTKPGDYWFPVSIRGTRRELCTVQVGSNDIKNIVTKPLVSWFNSGEGTAYCWE